MTATGRDDMHEGTSVEQHGLMAAPEVVKPQLLEPKLSRPANELLAHVARATSLRKSKRLGEHKCTLGQFNQPQVNRYAVRYAGNNPRMLFLLRYEQGEQVIVDRDGARVAVFLGPLDTNAVLGVLDRPLDPRVLLIGLRSLQRRANISPSLAPVNAATLTIPNSTDPLKPRASVRSCSSSSAMP